MSPYGPLDFPLSLSKINFLRGNISYFIYPFMPINKHTKLQQIKSINRYKIVICDLENYHFWFQENNLDLDRDSGGPRFEFFSWNVKLQKNVFLLIKKRIGASDGTRISFTHWRTNEVQPHTTQNTTFSLPWYH